MRRLAAVAAVVLGLLAPPPLPVPHTAAASHCISNWIWSGSYYSGAMVQCFDTYRWRVVVGCYEGTGGSLGGTYYGQWRYDNGVGGSISSLKCPPTRRYAHWYSYQKSV